MKRILIAGLVLLLIIYCGTAFLLSAFPHTIITQSIQQRGILKDLEKNEEVWNESKPPHYRIKIKNQGYSSNWLTCLELELDVKNGTFFRVDEAGDNDQWCVDIYEDLTVDGLFELAKSYLLRDDPIRVRIWDIDYDENTGMITHISVQVKPTMYDAVLYGNDYLSVVNPELFDLWITDFTPLP